MQDLQQAIVDTRVAPRGKLVIWLMRHNPGLFQRLSSYGLHAIQVHYANRWFSLCCREKPVGEHCRGNIRLEAATGRDFSDEVDIPGRRWRHLRVRHVLRGVVPKDQAQLAIQ